MPVIPTSVSAYFAGLPDPRVERTKEHRLVDILTIGLLNEVTSEENLYVRAGEAARTVAENAPLTVRTAKQELNRVVRHWAPAGSREHVVLAYMSEDFKEGIEAFLGKRKPRWRGK